MGMVIDAIWYWIILILFITTYIYTNFLSTFLVKSVTANNIVKAYSPDELYYYNEKGFDVYTVPTWKNWFNWDWIYLYWNYDKITKNDIDYIHSHQYPIYILYCAESLWGFRIKCIKIY